MFRSGNFLIAEREAEMLGCVYVEVKATEPARSYLGLLSVDPSRQQGGLGSLLMEAAEEYCRGRGCTEMDILVVSLREDLPAFYQKRGYTQTGTSPFPEDVPTKIPCHFIEMSKKL
jgi:GNAT superfamily N-acetyltransferase